MPVNSANTGCFVHFSGGSPAVLTHEGRLELGGQQDVVEKYKLMGFYK